MKSNEVFKQYLQAIEDTIKHLPFEGTPESLYEPLRYIMSIGGKRMRPMLVLLAHQLYRNDVDKALIPAVAVEVFHNFTLMHDDIMDKAPLRRGKPTVHQKWNDSTAILSGDVMIVKAYELFMSAGDPQMAAILESFNKVATEVCEGQQIDMEFEQRTTVSVGEYLEMIRLKTAVLLGFSLRLGAMVASAPNEEVELLAQFGEEMGIGFQLKDDYLDAYGSEGFGKQVGGDIIANKKTYLMIRALEKATGDELSKLEFWLTNSDFDPAEKVSDVMRIYNTLEIEQEVSSMIEKRFSNAFNLLDKLSVSGPKKDELIVYCHLIMNRIK
jgi:geranylgeranyl diphosphate synthase type II